MNIELENKIMKSALTAYQIYCSFCPEDYDAIDCRQKFCEENVNILLKEYTIKPSLYSEEIKSVLNHLYPEIQEPTNEQDAYDLYVKTFQRLPDFERKKN